MKIFWQQCEGQIVDGFPLRQYLGGGDSQAVFLTEYAGDATRKAAIKIMHADPESTESQLKRWRLASELSHPNLARLFERGAWTLNQVPLLYVVMEYADENLSQVIPERALTVEEAKEMLGPALEALAYLHSKGFAHGHVKPSNFLAIDGGLKISSDSVVQSGPATAGPADDVWSLGMTLVEALTQRLPEWNPADARDPALPAALPVEFQEIARQALRRDPSKRWTVAQIQQRLSGQPEPPAPKRRVSAAVAGTGLLLILLAMVAGVLRLRNRESAVAPQSQTQPTQTQPAPAPTTIAVPKPPPPEPETKPAAPPQARPDHGDILHQVVPEALARARNTIHGKVTVKVRVDVDPSGNVTGTTIEPPETSQYFRNLADQAAKRWKFAPADVPRVWILRFDFTRAGTKVAPTKATR